MSTQPLYHALGLVGYDLIDVKMNESCTILHVAPKEDMIRCPFCASKNVIRKGVYQRCLKHIPIGKRPIRLMVDVPRVSCRVCGCIRRVKIDLADGRKGYTKALANFVVQLARAMPLKEIGAMFGLGWDCVKDIVKSNLELRFRDQSFSELKYIAIDEISIKKGYKFITLVMDLETGRVVFVGDGKDGKALDTFWEQLRESGCRLKGISTDLGKAYISSVLENQSGVPLIFDHFHFVKLVNEALTTIRRELYNECKNVMHKKVIKGTRWVLLKNPENLSKERGEQEHLEEALKLNHPLAHAYYMKEEFRELWKQADKASAEKAIESWILNAWSSGIGPLMKLGNTLAIYKFGILNWYDHPISSGRLEGTNNKIKVLKRTAYGYRDMEFFKLRIMAIHEARYGLTG